MPEEREYEHPPTIQCTLVDGDIPAGIARDIEVIAAIAAHALNAAAHHAPYTHPAGIQCTLVEGDIPAAIARDAEVTAAITAHAALPNVHHTPAGANLLETVYAEALGQTTQFRPWESKVSVNLTVGSGEILICMASWAAKISYNTDECQIRLYDGSSGYETVEQNTDYSAGSIVQRIYGLVGSITITLQFQSSVITSSHRAYMKWARLTVMRVSV